MKEKIIAVICVVLLLCVFTSCAGRDGVGVTDAHINENGELILRYDDGREQNLGIVVGKDGKDGADGEDGEDGKDGRDGVDGENGKDGINGSDGESGRTVVSDEDEINISACAIGLRSAVSIECVYETTAQQGGFRPGTGSTAAKQYSTAGSGVIYRMDREAGDAFVITNYHVVYDADSNTDNGISDDITVYLYGSELSEKGIKAEFVGGSLYYDIAILHISDSCVLRDSDACAATTADSDLLSVGDRAIAIGNAQGAGISASSGIISVNSEYITMTAADEKTEVSFRVMRVDTAVNSGNSGGGLYDGSGRLIGIVNAKMVEDSVENIGYAIPSNVAVSIARNIIDYCYGQDTECVRRALLGITVTTTDSCAVFDAGTGRIRIEDTVSVYEVSEDGLAAGKLQPGDILLRAALNGSEIDITRQYHIIDLMLDVRVGDTVTLTILRDGEELRVEFSITENCLANY